MARQKIKVGEEFRPSRRLRTLYYTYFLIFLLIVFIPLQLPVIFATFPAAMTYMTFVSFPILLIFLFVFFWVGKYYRTIIYKITKSEIEWRRGVWFRNMGVVPYNRITNVDVSQGPVSRALGFGSLKIQTAGYSSPNARSSEIKLDGIVDLEGLRETMMEFVRGGKATAVETFENPPASGEESILGELVKIRKLLERKK